MNPLTPETYWLQQGVLGVIIVSLLGTFVPLTIFLYKQLQNVVKEKDTEIKALNAAINVLQDKRVADNAQIIGAFSQLGEKLVAGDEAIQKSVEGIPAVLQSIRELLINQNR